jgi:hypothetical protein
MPAELIFVIVCTVLGGVLGAIFATWYVWAFYGFLIGIGIPLIGMFGIID